MQEKAKSAILKATGNAKRAQTATRSKKEFNEKDNQNAYEIPIMECTF